MHVHIALRLMNMAEAYCSDDDDRVFLSYLSKEIYERLNIKIGSEGIVTLRWRAFDVMDTLNNCDIENDIVTCIRGSYAEGFEMPSSDVDAMLFHRNIAIYRKEHFISKLNRAVFLVENHDTSPGFVFIKCQKIEDCDELLLPTIVNREDGFYVSSKLYKERLLTNSVRVSDHGPCKTTTFRDVECDLVPCLYSPSWPTQAFPFIQRSIRLGWPSMEVLTDICKDGCLFVPVSNRSSYNDSCGDMWRISFSLAEKRIVQSMTHPQFLSYGLLKLFLNEVLKSDQPNAAMLLCSYHMKNVLFWEVSKRSNDWSIGNFLNKFWRMFRCLLKWIDIGYCPHYFVPERNMFLGRLSSTKQRQLLNLLNSFYKEGAFCLFRLPFLENAFNLNLCSLPNHFSMIPEHSMENTFRAIVIQRKRFDIILQFQDIAVNDLDRAINVLKNTVAIENTSSEMLSAKKLRINFILQRIAEMHLNNSTSNKEQYYENRYAFDILRKSKTYFLTGEIIIAKYLYKCGSYHQAKILLNRIRSKIQVHRISYKWNLDNELLHLSQLGNFPIEATVQNSVLSHVVLNYTDTIQELWNECMAEVKSLSETELRVPPILFIDFLSLLTSNKLGEFDQQRRYLNQINDLLLYDNGFHIQPYEKAISWEILGICQQLCGEKESAFTSYIKALHDRYNSFKQATIFRLRSLRS